MKNNNIEKAKEDEKQRKIDEIQKEINKVDNLIKKTNEKLKLFENKTKENNIFLLYEEIYKINGINNCKNKTKLIGIKDNTNKSPIFEYQNIENPDELYFKKKKEMEEEKLKYKKEYLDLCKYSNRIYIDSSDAKSPLDIFLIEPKAQIKEQIKEEENNQINKYKTEKFEDKFTDIMKKHINYLNDSNFGKFSFNSDFSIFENNSNINNL